jgi:NAD(P)-dependent dehydrogenase (short-subunit alcohol dehydrogenase family)
MAVLITGCSTGIGRATAERLASRGQTVYATARRRAAVEDLEAKGCRILELDVTDEASMRAAVARVEEEHGAVSALVNNAGYSQSGVLETVDMDGVRRQFETNVFGLLRMCQLVLPAMRAAGTGRIVNLSSMGGKMTFPGGGVYHATKFAVEALSDVLRFEVGGFGVHVVVIEPGLIRTNFSQNAVATIEHDPDSPYAKLQAHVSATTVAAYERGVTAKLAGEAEDVAKVIEKAITVRRPRARYTVTPSAKLILAQRRLLPDRAWDAVMSTQFPRPGR